MDSQTIVVDEDSHRLWPRAQSPWSGSGEWDLTIRGTEEDFVDIHRALFNFGYYIDESGDWEVYTRLKENAVEAMIDVWEFQCEALDANLLFDNYEDLLDCLNREMELAEEGEPLQFTISRSQMTQSEYDRLPEVEP
jgi:hypothetical protein